MKAKEDLTTAGLRLRAMIRAFKENQFYDTPLPAEDSVQGKEQGHSDNVHGSRHGRMRQGTRCSDNVL